MSSCKVIYLKKKKEFKEDIPNLPQIVVRTIFREVVGGVAGRGSHGGHKGPNVLNPKAQQPSSTQAPKHSSPQFPKP